MTDIDTERPAHPPPDAPFTVPHRDLREGPWPVILLVVALVFVGLRFGWWPVAVFLCIGLMIFLHELGHYLTAKWGGMKVTEFFLGFGPRLWSFTKGETTYGLKAIPFGAYVKIIGMHNLEEVPPEDEPRTYRQASYPRRMAVAVAGSSMHFLQAFVLLMVIYVGFGVADHHRWKVDQVVPGSAAEQAGLKPGDRPVALDGQPFARWENLTAALEPKAGQPVALTYVRDGQTRTTVLTAGERLSAAGADQIDGTGGLLDHDRIVSVDGTPVSGYAQFASMVTVGNRYTVEVPRGTNTLCSVAVTVRALPPAAVATAGFLGLSATFDRTRTDPFTGAARSVAAFGRVTGAAATGIARFFTPSNVSTFVSDSFHASSDNGQPVCHALSSQDNSRILSIVGVGQIATQAGRNGLDSFLELLALFNIFIGVFNLLPVLPFDGGHVVVATYERIRSKRGRRYYADVTRLLPITYAVTMVIVTLGVLAIYRDILQPPSLGG